MDIKNYLTIRLESLKEQMELLNKHNMTGPYWETDHTILNAKIKEIETILKVMED